jgi:hypothetical protein
VPICPKLHPHRRRWGDGEIGRWGDGEIGKMRGNNYFYNAYLPQKYLCLLLIKNNQKLTTNNE